MTRILHHPLAAPSRLDAMIAGVRDGLARRRACLATLRGLDVLTDRNLADLGFFRCVLRRIARESLKAGR